MKVKLDVNSGKVVDDVWVSMKGMEFSKGKDKVDDEVGPW